jgi:hypothetical protein
MGWRKCGGLFKLVPGDLAAGYSFVCRVAWAVPEIGEIVPFNAGPVRKRGLIDIENDSRFGHLRCAHLNPSPRFGQLLLDLGIIFGAAVIEQLRFD